MSSAAAAAGMVPAASAVSFLLAGGAAAAVRCSAGLSAGALLAALPAGAYTTLRCSGAGGPAPRALFEWEAHVGRTARSAALLLAGAGDDAAPRARAAPLAQPAALRAAMAAGVRAALRVYDGGGADAGTGASSGGTAGEVKVTVLATWESGSAAARLAELLRAHGEGAGAGAAAAALAAAAAAAPPPAWLLCTHVCPLPVRRAPPVIVQLLGAPRGNAAAKDSSWVAARRPLEAQRGADVEEQLLCDDATGAVLEGTQTNVFALCADGVLRTAGTGVLEGTVRGIVLDLCTAPGAQERGLPRLALEAPVRADIDGDGPQRWLGAFITSTSRLVLPVDELRWEGGAHRFAPQPPSFALMERLVAEQVAQRSTVLGDTDDGSGGGGGGLLA